MAAEEHPPPPSPEEELGAATVSWAGTARPAPVEVPGAPASVRYSVIEQVGAGGMGVVYLAHDRELNRRVALKVLRPESRTEGADARLQREAQAMARLQHPNVVAVYDVGRLEEGQVFVAMELVEGTSLRRWLHAEKRSWREVVASFLAAGTGLQAAHAAGLVHRDFKPDNVLVGNDGAVRVADFGLARLAERDGAVESLTPADGSLALPDTLAQPLTRTGAMVGTPLYMSPEQLRGQPSDARSDQFGFCVALYEALYGQRPFEGRTALALLEAMRAGPRKPPRGSRAPRRLYDALARGLRVEPADRWPSMDELLRELQRDPWRERRPLLVGASLMLALLVVGVAAQRAQQQRSQLCRGAERKLRGVWDGERREAVRAAFLASKLPYAQAAADEALRALDAYASAFAAAHVDACEATQLRGEQSPMVMDLRMRCLDRRLQSLAALASVFAGADAKVVEGAPRATQGLPEVSGCADVAALQQPLPLPKTPGAQAAIDALFARLSRLDALSLTRKGKEGVPQGLQLVEEARKLEYPPLMAEAQLELGILQEDAGNFKAAEAALQEALFAAQAGRADELVARAATALAIDVGRAQNRVSEGRLWARLAQAALRRSPSPRLEQRLEQALGLIDYADGRFDDARAHYQRSLALAEKVWGPSPKQSGDLWNSLGGAENAQGRYDQALADYRKALAVYERFYGSAHPQLLAVHSNIATIAYARGRYAEAEAGFRRAVEQYERALGPHHPRVAVQLTNLAESLLQQDRAEEATRLLLRAVAIGTKALGSSHRTTIKAHVSLGQALLQRNQPAAAREELQRALDDLTKTLGPDHPELVNPLVLLSEAQRDSGKTTAAVALARRALQIAEKHLGKQHPETASAQLALAESLLHAGRAAEALELARRGHATLEKALGKENPDVLLAQGLIAEALLARGQRQQGREQIESAVAAWRRIGGGRRGERLEHLAARAQTQR